MSLSRSPCQPERARRSGTDELLGHFLLGLMLRRPPADFLFCALAGVAILFLEQADQFVVLAAHSLQVVVGELAPPVFGLAPDLLPLAFEYILVHGVILLDPSVNCPALR